MKEFSQDTEDGFSEFKRYHMLCLDEGIDTIRWAARFSLLLPAARRMLLKPFNPSRKRSNYVPVFGW